MTQAAPVIDLETYRRRQQRPARGPATCHGMRQQHPVWLPVWVVWVPVWPVA